MLLGNRPISKLGYSSHSVELVIQFKKKNKGCRIEPHFCSSAQNEVLVARGVMQPAAIQPAQVGLQGEFLSTGAWLASGPLLPLLVAGVSQRGLPPMLSK